MVARLMLIQKKQMMKKKNNLIYEVLKDGYKIQLTDSNTRIIKKALVKVYEFKKNNDNIKET